MTPPPKYVDDDDDTDEISDEDDEVPRRRRNSAFKRAVRKITLARVCGLRGNNAELDLTPPSSGRKLGHGRIQREDRGSDPPLEKSQKYRVS